MNAYNLALIQFLLETKSNFHICNVASSSVKQKTHADGLCNKWKSKRVTKRALSDSICSKLLWLSSCLDK